MELEARSNAFVETILKKVQAQKHLVKRYLDGESPVTEVMSVEESDEGGVVDSEGKRSKLTQSQKRLMTEIKDRMENAMAAAEARDDETVEACVAAAATNRILFANGPPGTGKTYVVH